MRVDPKSLQFPPSTSSKLELAYALMREAELQQPGEDGKFRAMDCHSDIISLASLDYSVGDAVYELGMSQRIGANQRRLGI